MNPDRSVLTAIEAALKAIGSPRRSPSSASTARLEHIKKALTAMRGWYVQTPEALGEQDEALVHQLESLTKLLQGEATIDDNLPPIEQKLHRLALSLLTYAIGV